MNSTQVKTLPALEGLKAAIRAPSANEGIFFTCIAIGIILLYQWLLPKPIPGIPYNLEATKNLFGDAPGMSKEIEKTGEFSMWLGKQVKKLQSPVCQVFIRPFSKPWILVGDFRESQDIMMRRRQFDKPQFLIDGMQPLGDFNARYRTNDAFKARRHMKQDLMTPSFLNNIMGPFMHEEALKLIKLLETKVELAQGRPFAARSDFYHTALDVMTHYAFGRNLSEKALDPVLEHVLEMKPSDLPGGSEDDPLTFPEPPLSDFLVAIQKAPDVLEMTTIAWLPKLSFWWWKHQPWYKRIFSQKDRVMPQQVETAIENYRSGEICTALEHILLREDNSAKKRGISPDFGHQGIKDEVFADMLSGHHTTGGTLGWVTKFLTGYPEAQKRLHEALFSAFSQAVSEKRYPSFDEIRRTKIPYLDAVIEETLRLTPFSMTRETAEDTDILGFHVPKGCQIFLVNGGPGYLSPSIPVNEDHRSATSKLAKGRSTWDESKDLSLFEPERWLVTKEDGTVDFDGAAGPQLGFGLGIRQCWGRRMAHLEIRTTVAMLMLKFELQPIPENLGGYAGFDGISRQPQRVFLRPKVISDIAA